MSFAQQSIGMKTHMLRLLTAAIFVVRHAGLMCAAEVEAPGSPVDLWKIEFKSRDQLIIDTAGDIQPKSIQSYGSFESYWKASSTGRDGKVFEAVVADNFNSANRAAGKRSRLVPTAAIGEPSSAADLLIVDARGQRLGQVQAKLGFPGAVTALSDPRYAEMDVVTCRESYELIKRGLAVHEVTAARRGVPIPENWQRVKDALESGRLWSKLPSGSPLPLRTSVAQLGESVYSAHWSRRHAAMRLAKAAEAAAARSAQGDYSRRHVASSDTNADGWRYGKAENLSRAATEVDDANRLAVAPFGQAGKTLPQARSTYALSPPTDHGGASTTARLPASAGAGTRAAMKRIAKKMIVENGDDVAKATAVQSGGKILAGVAVPFGVAVEAGAKGYQSYQTEVRYDRGEISQNTREVEHARNVGGLAGSMGGAVAGGVVGAEVGTAVCPVIGTAVGTAVGVVGGAVAGEKAVAAASEAAVKAVHKTGTTIAGGAHAVAKGVRVTWKWATGW